MNPLIESLGWTLVHFLWQGAAISLVYAVTRAAMRRTGPNPRYLVACAALALMLAAPIATLLATAPAPEFPIGVAPARPSTHVPTADQLTHALLLPPPVAVPSSLMPWIVALWLTGAVIFWLRLTRAWVASTRVRSRMARPAPPEWQRTLEQLSARIGVTRAARLMVSPLVHAPAVAGWLRPVVLAPVGALAGLPADQVEALLLHELAHIRRNDYLVNILQSIVESLLFYHPAVWWVSGHIRLERELCCDDIACEATGDVLVYANALAGFAFQLGPPPSLEMSATGGRLSVRIARLLGQPQPAVRSVPGAGAAAAILFALAGCAVYAQTEVRPAFQVASIKRNAEPNPQAISVRPQPGGRLSTRNANLRILLQNAYELQAFQVIGGPEWVKTDGYDIEAKPEKSSSTAEMRKMLQTLLADRFKLTLHHETRELPEYALTLAKGGIKTAPAKSGSCVTPDPVAAPAPAPPPCGRVAIMGQPHGAILVGSQVPVAELARMMGVVMGSIVVDRTGYAGTLEVELPFAVDANTAGLPRVGDSGGGQSQAAPDPDASPSIFSSLQERLGLKMESVKGPVGVIVIDHVERPAEN